MPFTTKKRLQTSDDTLTGDAAQAINADFLILDNTAMFNRGLYSGGTAYVVNDVIHDESGNFYACILATTGNTPPNATYWLPLVPSALTVTSISSNASPLTITCGTGITFSGGGGSSPGVQTSSGNILDDGLGNTTVTGRLTLPISTSSPAHSATASVTGSTGTVHLDTQFAGTSGSTSYTINDIITLLKTAGILKA